MYFVSFVLTAQFVLVNVVIAVLMKHLEESNKEAKEEAELEAELELEMKILSSQPPSPLGSPFLWPGVEGPVSPKSPKPGAPHAAGPARAASRFSLEHSMVSKHLPLLQGGVRAGQTLGWLASGPMGGAWEVGSTNNPRGLPASSCPCCLDAEGCPVPSPS